VHSVSVSTTIGRPRGEIFEYLADMANHAEFTGHYLKDFRLTREDSYGLGAGARFKVKAPGNRFPWGEMTFTEVQAPSRIVERGRQGKFNRIQTIGTFELEELSSSSTRVKYTFESNPPKITDKFLESLGARSYVKRQNAKALRRLGAILEDGARRGTRATVAGGARKAASGFRF
jgi:uncharacterized protein YndB with AHSA1/START domain